MKCYCKVRKIGGSQISNSMISIIETEIPTFPLTKIKENINKPKLICLYSSS